MVWLVGDTGINRREDNEGAHNASFRICTKEIEALTEPLRCNEEYMRAVREEIESSNCVNELYHPDTDGYDESDVCVVNDERVNVALCSDACTSNQFDYLLCKYLGEEEVRLLRECGAAPEFIEIICTYTEVIVAVSPSELLTCRQYTRSVLKRTT